MLCKQKTNTETISDGISSIENDRTLYSQFEYSDEPKDLSEIPSLDIELLKDKRKRVTKQTRKN